MNDTTITSAELHEAIANRARALADDLAGLFEAALVRIWIAGPGDRCAACPMALRCADRSRCLHLVASAGLTARIDGQYARFPLSAPPLREVARTLSPRLARERLGEHGFAEAGWFAAHRIASFGAWPLVRAGRCAGVLVLFSRRVLDDEDARVLAAFARLASHALEAGGAAPLRSFAAPAAAPHTAALRAPAEPLPSLADTQRSAILRALEATGGRVSGAGGAAELLGLKPTTLESRIRKLGVRKPPRRAGALA